MADTGARTLDRGLTLMASIVADDGETPVTALAEALRLAPSSARRMLAMLERHGLVERIARGRYAGAARLAELAAHADPHRRLIAAARPLLHRLAIRPSAAAHLGVFDGDMVTYLVKEGGSGVFTRERGQLEAYCTGIGKALLAQLPPDQLERYLRGSFVRLTDRTLAEPEMLRANLALVCARGYAVDEGEMADDIACVAVPVEVHGRVVGAISLSGAPGVVRLEHATRIAARLVRCARAIAERMG